MIKKRKIVKLAKDIRKHTNRDFVNCIELAKTFLNGMEWKYSNKNANLGFVYEYEFFGVDYGDDLCFQGSIWDNKFKEQFKIPSEYYKLR